jgi:hypothetical protein
MKKQKLLFKTTESLKKLLKRASMTKHDYNSGVTRSTDNSMRIMVTSGRGDWKDCLGIQFRGERSPADEWHHMNVSPARARIIANQLLEQANRYEHGDLDTSGIDEYPK